ncbi:hypothetical protein C2E23DRAFT_858329 [Lenzites betulinus]|nr:hypothetical protein C2E23DRAFT_858329 [Lenzites betulinus]
MLPTRPLTPLHLVHPSSPGTSTHRQMASASTSAAAQATQPKLASFTAGYHDIFDAPERPGEPSTHVRFAAAAPSRASYSGSAPAAARSAPQTLPPPTLFDGPARPLPARAMVAPHRYRTYPSKVWPRPMAGGGRSAVSVHTHR